MGTAIAVHPGGSAYVTGVTATANFPVTPGVFQPEDGTTAKPRHYRVSRSVSVGTAATGFNFETFGTQLSCDHTASVVLERLET